MYFDIGLREESQARWREAQREVQASDSATEGKQPLPVHQTNTSHSAESPTSRRWVLETGASSRTREANTYEGDPGRLHKDGPSRWTRAKSDRGNPSPAWQRMKADES